MTAAVENNDFTFDVRSTFKPWNSAAVLTVMTVTDRKTAPTMEVSSQLKIGAAPMTLPRVRRDVPCRRAS